MIDKPKPLHTLRFHQMRFALVLSAMPLLIGMAVSTGGVMCGATIIGLIYLGLDLFAIVARK